MIQRLISKFKNENIKPINGVDAAFLYTETATSPMHVGAVSILESSLSFSTFRKIILSRLHLMPKLRQRLLYVPFSVDYPYWVDDPNFDIDLHLDHVRLPEPSNWKALRKMAADIFSKPLVKSRPLWSFTFVEGIDGVPQVPKGSVAIISRIHHVALDGVGSTGLMSLLFDMEPEGKEIPEPEPYKPAPLPNELKLLLNSTLSFAENPLKFPKLMREALEASIKSGALTRVQPATSPTAAFSAPPTPLNRIISARRKWNTSLISFNRVRHLKELMGVTVNDVLLAICSGALRKYLSEKGKLPKKPLVAMVPISMRNENESSSEGNLISSVLVQLATNIADPIERLEVINQNTLRAKAFNKAVGAKALTSVANAVPFGVANQAARLYSRYKLSELHNPIFNVTITNVPGPQFPLYLNGHKLISVSGMAPIIDGMGLIITIFSYNGIVSISPTSDQNSMPDIDLFSRYILESANELEAIILANKSEIEAAEDAQNSDEIAREVFDFFKTQLKKNAEFIKPNNGLFAFHLTQSDTHWRIDLNKSPALVRKGTVANPDVAFEIKDEHLLDLVSGKLNFQTAFIQGRLTFEGDMNRAMKLGTILSKLPQMEKETNDSE